MKLEIYDPEHLLDIHFARWLCYRIRFHVIHIIDHRKLKSWDEFFESSLKLPVKSHQVLVESAKNLRVKRLPDKIVIYMNKNCFMPGLDRVRVYPLLKLITFGNLSVRAYPIFTNTLQYFADNINEFVRLYEESH